MSEPERGETTSVATTDRSPSREAAAEKMCQGFWRLKPSVVLRQEEDGTILFDAETDALSVVNPVASALLRWRPDRIGFEEWCQALHAHYGPEAGLAQIQADVKNFLGAITHFVEPYDGQRNDNSVCS
jgi:hypothetical protein